MAEHIRTNILRVYWYATLPLRLLYSPILNRIPRTSRRWTITRRLVAATLTAGLLLVLSGLSFLVPRSATYNYAGETCVFSPTLLPKLARPHKSQSFEPQPTADILIAGYPVFSERTCVHMHRAATARSETASLVSSIIPFARKHITITPAPLAKVSRAAGTPAAVSVRDPLTFALSSPDQTYTYQLRVGKTATACTMARQQLTCDLTPLQLAQATPYQFTLQRTFKGQPAGTAFSQQIKTVEPITIVNSSIAAGQQVLDKPNELVITLNRPAKTLQDIKLVRLAGGKEEQLPIATELQDTKLIVRFSQPLPRSADLQLQVATLGAADGGYLAAPFNLGFKTSGGPKVVGINIGSYAVTSLPTINIRLDTGLAAGQNLGDSIRLEVGGKAIPAVVSGNGATISLKPQSAFGPCTTFVVKVLDSLQNLHGVAGGSAWQYQSRTTCQVVSSIGTSAQGRAITAYRFGSGASHMLFVGATHGDERSSAAILNSWINYLEANPGVIPASRSITIIPVVNPDGYAANKRTNANNVDLNRNFPANNWKQSVTMPDKSTNPNGGGSSPLSEPESRALANYTTALNPRLVLTYHATGNVAVPNLTGDSNDLAWKYARNSSVYYLNPNSTATFFEYDTTGAYEDWLHDKAGITALLIELNTSTGNEFNSHLPALKIMAGL